MKYALLHNFVIFLLMNNIHSEFLENSETLKEDGYHMGRFTPENGPNRMTDNRAYRSKHKYKVGTGHQGFLRRTIRSNTDIPQCAVMYRNNEPVGILQPYEDSYRFLPVKGEPTIVDINPMPIKRKSIIDVLYPSEMDDDDSGKIKDTVGFSDETYPSVFAKFRIDSRLARSWSPENYVKRSMFKREQANQQQSQESTDSETILDDVAVEGELKTILDDMGLIDDYPNRDVKRAIEDENLELGTNKISLFKEEHTESRGKRDDSNTTYMPIGIPSNTTLKFSKAAALKVSDGSDDELEREDDVILDEKRQGNDEIALSEYTSADDVVVVNEKNSPNEIRIERAIRDKIYKLKEEVKKEIDRLRGKTGGKKDKKNGGKKGGKKSDKKEGKKDERGDEEEEDIEDEKTDDLRRKKRQTFNTLVEEENKDIDPLTFNSEDEEVHVRRKRYIDFDDIDTSEKKFKSRSLKQLKSNGDNKPIDFSKKDSEGNFGSELLEDNAESYGDEYDESELDDNSEELYEVSEEAINDDTKTSDMYQNDICNCDKSSKECKCNFPSSIDRQPSKTQETLNVKADAVAADSSKEHWSCNKNGNWKCASSLLDDSNPAIDEDSSALETPKFESSERDTQAGTDTEHHCDCKNGNCKCGSLVDEPQPLIDRGYSTSDLPKNADNNLAGFSAEYGAIETDDAERTSKLSRQAIEPRNEAMEDFQNGEYFVDFHPGRYRFSSGETLRRKRENFEDVVAVHGGGPVRAHLAAIRERSMLPPAGLRSIRRVNREENNNEPRQLIDMSDEDIFGALPQGFQGGQQRYKRVKRD